MFRSSLTTAIGGFSAGIVAVVSDPAKASPIEAAFAALITAAAIAVTDYFARRRTRAEHEENVHREHVETRAVILGARRRASSNRRKNKPNKKLKRSKTL